MSDDMKAHGCAALQDELAELALGVLTGRERARALAHVESCARCAEELEHLSRAADAVVQVAPEIEPPMGFEVRLFERMGVSDVRHGRLRRLRPSTWAVGAFAAAAAVVALAVGLSLGLSSSPPPDAERLAGARRRDGQPGRERCAWSVASATYGGGHPWMSMMLVDSSVHGTVTCLVVTTDGVSHQVGHVHGQGGLRRLGRSAPRQPAGRP